MTAKVTDINQYRLEKGRIKIPTLAAMGDERIRTRYELLKAVQNMGEGYDPSNDRDVKSLFPVGYDPVNHPEDNILAVYEEGVRRGVFVP